MAVEKFANLAETTLSAGYTAGAGSISVTSAAGFPSSGVFRVRLGNVGKTIFRVDSVSGTTFTGAAEANDANANNGDSVILAASKAVAERWLQAPDAGGIDAIAGVSGADFYGPLYKLGRPDTISWAWQNQGGATIVDANGLSFLTVPSASTSVRSRLIAAVGTPWTITTLYKQRQATGTTQYAGLVLRESGTSKLYIYYVNGAGTIQAVKFTNDTTFSAVGAVNVAGPLGNIGQWTWLRIKDDGVNLVFSISQDGVNFIQLGSEGRTVFMAGGPNQYGLFGNVDSAAAAFDASFASFLQT